MMCVILSIFGKIYVEIIKKNILNFKNAGTYDKEGEIVYSMIYQVGTWSAPSQIEKRCNNMFFLSLVQAKARAARGLADLLFAVLRRMHNFRCKCS